MVIKHPHYVGLEGCQPYTPKSLWTAGQPSRSVTLESAESSRWSWLSEDPKEQKYSSTHENDNGSNTTAPLTTTTVSTTPPTTISTTIAKITVANCQLIQNRRKENASYVSVHIYTYVYSCGSSKVYACMYTTMYIYICIHIYINMCM